MNERRIEALVDAIANLKGSTTNPDGILYQIKNPTGILSFSKPGKNEIDPEGRRVFKSWLAGYRAACFDITVKISGGSRAGIKKDDNLSNLLRVYGLTERLAHQQITKFLRRALKDQTITSETPLAYFRGE
jgi:hypothetical protein